VLCVVRQRSATVLSFIQRFPIECGVSECDSEAWTMRRSWPTRGCLSCHGGDKLCEPLPVSHRSYIASYQHSARPRSLATGIGPIPTSVSYNPNKNRRLQPAVPYHWYTRITSCFSHVLTLRLLISYTYGAPSKARNANVVYIWTYVWQR